MEPLPSNGGFLSPEPPPGWIALQARAKQAKDPKELAALIEEMNQLLAEYEKAAGDEHKLGKRPARSRKSAKKKAPKT